MIKISVLIDTYNHEKYIEEAINSVLEQEDLDDIALEIIVIDDGSTDGTGEIIKKFGSVLRYYRKRNGGQASAFNMGIRLCEGEIICFLDGDDWWHPRKVSAVVNAFRENPALCAIGHSFLEVDEVSNSCFRSGPDNPVAIDYGSRASVSLFHELACCLGTSRLAIKRLTAQNLLDVPEPLVFEADEYLFTLLPTVGEVVILPEVLTYYRIHGANLFQDSRAVPVRFAKNSRLFKRASIYECLKTKLPTELAKRGCDSAIIERLLLPIEIQASRLKLMTYGGTRLENFRSEWRAAGLFERNTLIRKSVLGLSLGLALLFSPKWYFIMRQGYANVLRRVRG